MRIRNGHSAFFGWKAATVDFHSIGRITNLKLRLTNHRNKAAIGGESHLLREIWMRNVEKPVSSSVEHRYLKTVGAHGHAVARRRPSHTLWKSEAEISHDFALQVGNYEFVHISTNQ